MNLRLITIDKGSEIQNIIIKLTFI